jgi:tRNA(Ile)-lysidine synthase
MAKPSPSRRVISRFETFLKKNGLVRQGDTVLVAFSGGPDSSALLALFLEIREKWSLDLVLAHFNHRLRRGAGGDARWAQETARRLGLRFCPGEADVRGWARRRGLNLEEAARLVRYDFLRKTARRIKAAKIATGHTLTDQAETLLMRLLRGSGSAGLAGIYPRVDGLIIRPLLDFEREELAAFLKEKRWTCREDESNRDPRYLRSRIRHELIPFLRKKYEPAVVKHLGIAALILRDENRILKELAGRRARKVLARGRTGPVLDLARLKRIPAGLSRRVIRCFIQELKGDLRDVSFQDVESLAGLGPNKEFVLSPQLVLCREGDLVFQKREQRGTPKYDFLWDGRGLLPIPGARLFLRGRLLSGRPVPGLDFDDERRVYCDASKIVFPLRVRRRLAGDKYRPLGAPGSKKLKEILRAKGVPLADRDRRPVVCSGGRIVWMPGLAVAQEFRVMPGASRILMIEKLENL